jgi:transposase
VIATGARRRWTLAEKHRIVAESYGAPRLVSATAPRNGLSASQLFNWRRLAREGRLVEAGEATTFTPAVIGSEPCSPPAFLEQLAVVNAPSSPSRVGAVGRIENVLMYGRRVVVDNGVDATVLARATARLHFMPTEPHSPA